mmetsp:Transcript_16121/g.32970  ORF Transcript_16121/g.32970 Transcript_16121/m.32970 type:complete len:457 (-) Transcript_16121:73-1443(-)
MQNALLVCIILGVATLALDVSFLTSRTSVYQAPSLISAGNGSYAQEFEDDEDDFAQHNQSRSRLLLYRGRIPATPEVFGGVIMMRPNYTTPACLIARKGGPWRSAVSENVGVGRAAPQRPRRILVLGMQSSGASTVLFLLAQIPNSVAVVDLWVGRPAPQPGELGLSDTVSCILLKATINTLVDARAYLDQFQPDISILLLRHPAHNYKSLSNKSYRDTAGSPEEKLVALERAFLRRNALFSLILAYEDVFKHQEKVVRRLQAKLGLTRATGDCLFDFKRRVEHIQAFTNSHCEWCRLTFNTRWGYGNLRTTGDSKISFQSSPSSSLPPSTMEGTSPSPLLEWRYVDKNPSDRDFTIALRLAPTTTGWYAVKYPELSSTKNNAVSTATPSSPQKGQEAWPAEREQGSTRGKMPTGSTDFSGGVNSRQGDRRFSTRPRGSAVSDEMGDKGREFDGGW